MLIPLYYVYVLESVRDNRFYTGYTTDLRKRLKEHNDGLVNSSKTRVPFKLVYYEACLCKEDATAREKYLKSGMGKRYLKNRLKGHFSMNDFSKSLGAPR